MVIRVDRVGEFNKGMFIEKDEKVLIIGQDGKEIGVLESKCDGFDLRPNEGGLQPFRTTASGERGSQALIIGDLVYRAEKKN